MTVTTSANCISSFVDSTFVLRRPNPEIILEGNYTVDPPCGNNIGIRPIGLLADLNDSTNLGPNYNYYWIYENSLNYNNPVSPPFIVNSPSNNDSITFYTINYYGLPGDSIVRECEANTTLAIETFANIQANLNVSPESMCEPGVILLEGSYNEIGSSGVFDPVILYGYNIIDEYGTPFSEFDQLIFQSSNINNIYSNEFNDSLGTNGFITNYTTSFFVETEAGCTDTIEKEIEIYPTPTELSFDYEAVLTDAGAYYGEYEFSASAQSSNGTIINDPPFKFSWSINGETINKFGEIIRYRFPSTNNYEGTEYQICLTVTSPNNLSYQCEDSICKNILVDYAKGLFIPNALTPDANFGLSREFLPAGKSLES